MRGLGTQPAMGTNRTVSQRNILNLELLWDRLGLGQHCQKNSHWTNWRKRKGICRYKGIGHVCTSVPNSYLFHFVTSYQWSQVIEILRSHPVAWLQIASVITDGPSPAVGLNAKQERNYSFGRTPKALKFLQPFFSQFYYFFHLLLKI